MASGGSGRRGIPTSRKFGQKRGTREINLVFAGFLWSDVAGLANLIDVQPRWRELSDLPSAARWQRHVEYLRANHATGGALVHRQEMPTNPVPSVIAMRVVDSHLDFELRLSPEARPVRGWQADAWIEVGQLQLASFAVKLDARLVVRIFLEEVLGQKFEANLLGSGHFIDRLKLHPFAASADAILLVLIRTHGAALGKRSGSAKSNARQRRVKRQSGKIEFTRITRFVHGVLHTTSPII